MNVMNYITYGLYVLSVREGGKDSGCMINTLLQQTSQPEQVSVTVNKANYTAEILLRTRKASVAMLSTATAFDFIKGFGMRSGRDCDKFDGVEAKRAENGILVPTASIVGYLNIEVKETLDLGTHIQFLCYVTGSEVFGGEPLTYAYYHANVKPRPAAQAGSDDYVCTICGYVRKGKPEADYVCPVCKHGAEVFVKAGAPRAEAAVKNAVVKEIKPLKGESKNMAKFVCTVCGYVHEGDSAPEFCPICKAPAEKFVKQEGEMTWASEHVVGVAKGVSEDIIMDLRANFEGECSEVGMYLAMARVAHREGYPEVGLYYEKAAWEEAEHAAKFAELLGEVVTDSTKKNLEMRIEAENGATAGKTDLAKRAKAQNLDAIHDTVHEMARDEARHGKAFLGLYNRYFKK